MGTPAAYALDLCARIALCTDVPQTITRLFLSSATRKVQALLRAEMEALGMAVRLDAAGNLRGIYRAEDPEAPVFLTGSHLDTVPDAGAYDGLLGIAVPLAALRALNGRSLAFAIEVIAFSEEEGIRFKMPFIGSRAVIGTLSEPDLQRADAAGATVAGALRSYGLDPSRLDDAALTPGTFAFLEVHLEQGPVLESLDLSLGIVTSIIGQTRMEVSFHGSANHAGTTPMHLRHDALAAAAAWISEVERYARACDGLVATVGTISVTPGAVNVIPGSAVLTLDVRHASDGTRGRAVDDLLDKAREDAVGRGVRVAAKRLSHQDAVAMDERLGALLAVSQQTPHRMVSGAGHDAMMLAARVPSAMLFVRTPAGLSHHPNEAVAAEDMQAAIETLLQLFQTPDLLVKEKK